MRSHVWQDKVAFSEETASKLLWRELIKQFGVNLWVGETRVRTEEGILSIGTTAVGSNIAFVLAITETASLDTVGDVVEGLTKFPKFFPEHATKPLRGLIAAAKLSPSIARMAHRQGLYLVELNAGSSKFKRLLPPPMSENFNRVRIDGET